jgi:hypothetical protein
MEGVLNLRAAPLSALALPACQAQKRVCCEFRRKAARFLGKVPRLRRTKQSGD